MRQYRAAKDFLSKANSALLLVDNDNTNYASLEEFNSCRHD